MHNIFFSADFLMLCSIIELYNADLNRYFWIEVKILESTNHSNSDNSVEKAMATHSSTPVWKIPWMVEPGRLRPMGSLRVRHDWATSLSLLTFTHWRRKWQPTPVFLPGESQGQGTLVGCCPWGHTESDTTEATQQQQQQQGIKRQGKEENRKRKLKVIKRMKYKF